MRFPATGWRPFDGHSGLRNWPPSRLAPQLWRIHISLLSSLCCCNFIQPPRFYGQNAVRELSSLGLDEGRVYGCYGPMMT